MSDAVASASLCAIAERIASRDISAVEVCENAIRRGEQLQPTLNAFISLQAEAAIAAAREVDARIGKGEVPGPLAGVPLAHKDMFYR